MAAKVLGVSVLDIEVVDGHEAMDAFIAGRFAEGFVSRDGNVYSLRFEGGGAEASALLKDLINAGVSVASFARKRGDLEDVFLKVGAREVS